MKLEQEHDQMDWGQQGVIRPASPEAWSQGSGPLEGEGERERELEGAYLNSHRTPDETG